MRGFSKEESINRLMNADINLSWSTKENYFYKSLKILKRYGLVEKDGIITIPKIYPHVSKSSNISDEEFLFKLLKEVLQRGKPGINTGDILNKLCITKLLLLQKTELTFLLSNCFKKNYISFGHLTGGTINFNKEKIRMMIKKSEYKRIYDDYDISKIKNVRPSWKRWENEYFHE